MWIQLAFHTGIEWNPPKSGLEIVNPSVWPIAKDQYGHKGGARSMCSSTWTFAIFAKQKGHPQGFKKEGKAIELPFLFLRTSNP